MGHIRTYLTNKMKFLILALAIAGAQALPQQEVPIVRQNYDIGPDGSYKYEFETGNGIYAEAQGALKKGPNSDYPSIETKGSFKYTSPEGEPVEISYLANEDGYQPQGSHIPVAPPVPEYILRAIQYIDSHPPPPPPPGRF